MKSTKHLIKIFCLFMFFIASSFVSAETSEHKIHSFVLATATPGGTFYPVGVAIATLISAKLEGDHGIAMTAISSAGSGENINLIKSEYAQFAILQGLYGSLAWKGKGELKQSGPQQELRSITMLWQNVEHFTVQKSKVKKGDISDLSGFNKAGFSIGEKNSGTEGSGRYILKSLGINPDVVFDIRQKRYSASALALTNGSILGMNTPGGVPVKAVTQAFSVRGRDLIILDITNKQLEMINSNHNLWSRYIIPAGTYPTQTKDVYTIAQSNVLAVHKDTDAAAVYLITKTIYEHLDYFSRIHGATNVMKISKALEGLPMPLHPGAIRYYKERGIQIPPSLVKEQD